MSWSGQLAFGEYCAAYRGKTGDNRLHRHAALQIVFAQSGTASITGSDKRVHQGRVLLIRPMAAHKLDAASAVTVLYVEAQSPLAKTLNLRFAASDIVAVEDQSFLAHDFDRPLDAWLKDLGRGDGDAAPVMDARLSQALILLRKTTAPLSIREVAARVGLSESRLRNLAQDQLGFPIATWMVWRKLNRAAQALDARASLAEAAIAGGFSDQAHMTRCMRRMLGITPHTARTAIP
ncbi:AraC family transcriptional regulator [Brevundimonas naejangsanensis]|uniref:helix-turn-helix domain-containing protein n=1 Tax=Brevundimonas naejangsanensis TaxID=588932 RepID=UPI00320914D8